jgi:hypothetical protein
VIKTDNAQYNISSNEFNYIEIDGSYLTMNFIKIKVISPSNIHFNLLYMRDIDYGEIIAFNPLNKSIDIIVEIQFNISLNGDPAVRGANFNWNRTTNILRIYPHSKEFNIYLPYWWEKQILMYMGILGFAFLFLAPTITIIECKNGNYRWLLYGLLLILLGIGLIRGWLYL